ncbi:uncharacterized protein GGS22DRAFT_153820 [Annulohypoxylon maeteangense]|uniref:uncharacterized protein n=1 Tax=Annulohypoxylon maeteangense TaxID=1927788 RepID=UPI0020085BEA|nr:uncharacterized protein GGS22DRAFT_153820 [Annulohypoxylon maeteangense]KAI0889409.1 hypothetical protein GGS22DRAFT_153820 [Annulohypoxylon maeteangense]
MQNNTPSSSHPLAARVPGQLHTPTHSFSDAAFTPDSLDGRNISWDKKSKDDFELARARLSDQKFNIKQYDDPLLPRQHPPSHFYPNGVTAETEARLLKVIAKAKGSSK